MANINEFHCSKFDCIISLFNWKLFIYLQLNMVFSWGNKIQPYEKANWFSLSKQSGEIKNESIWLENSIPLQLKAHSSIWSAVLVSTANYTNFMLPTFGRSKGNLISTSVYWVSQYVCVCVCVCAGMWASTFVEWFNLPPIHSFWWPT